MITCPVRMKLTLKDINKQLEMILVNIIYMIVTNVD